MQRQIAVHFGQGVLVLFLIVFAFVNDARASSTMTGSEVTLPEIEVKTFGTLPPLKPIQVSPSIKEQDASVEKAGNYQQILAGLGIKLTSAQKAFLNDHRFLLVPKSETRFRGMVSLGDYGYDEMLGLFDEIGGGSDIMSRQPENCHLINPDVMLHAFHKYMENSLEYLEKTELAPALRRFLTNARDLALLYTREGSKGVAKSYERIAAQLTIPLVILENAEWPDTEEQNEALMDPSYTPPVDDGDTLKNGLRILNQYKRKFSSKMFNRMVEELKLIYGAQGIAVSPLFGEYDPEGQLKSDYTQYTPRSHYTKSSVLRSYFRAMMYLGRNSYLLAGRDGLGDALLMLYLMAESKTKDHPILDDWQRIMAVTSFYAGQSDDIGYPDLRDFVTTVLGSSEISAEMALNPATLEKLSARLIELRGPRILSDVIVDPDIAAKSKDDLLNSTKGFRIFGQRFTFDGWILSRLTAGQEMSPLRLPSTPSALFVPSVMGDKTAEMFSNEYLRRLSDPFSSNEIIAFNGRVDEIRTDLKKVDDGEWYGSLSSAWLNLLGTLTGSYKDGYPLYMRDALFPVKQLETFLGSYTELKHDTLLYAKQSYSEMGSGEDEGTPPPVPKGFVEPNLAFWQNLGRLVDYVWTGFAQYGLFPNELEEYGSLSIFKRHVEMFGALAVKELKSVPLTEDEYESIRTIQLGYMATPFEIGRVLEEKDQRSGLIADIHTDAVKQQILYEATAEPYIMLVLIGNENSVRLTAGVAFNHYELTGPLTTRFSDDDWQKRVYEGQSSLPKKNFWYDDLIAK